jgi:geranylgeranyl diphosphate synthase, type II
LDARSAAPTACTLRRYPSIQTLTFPIDENLAALHCTHCETKVHKISVVNPSVAKNMLASPDTVGIIPRVMKVHRRIEQALASGLEQATSASCPPKLQQAMRHAVFPGGSRFRPELCIIVADACGAAPPGLAEVSAASIELLHCASLVYDDLPCFDDAPVRRGVPTVHTLFGEDMAVLVGNALTVLAFEIVAQATSRHPELLLALLRVISSGANSSSGIVAGQAWECEETVDDLGAYHRAKTGALFESAILTGATVGGDDPRSWRELGYIIGEAYQIADDLRDAAGDADLIGKPVGQDVAHDRPSAVVRLGVAGCVRKIGELIEDASARVPRCPGRGEVLALIRRLELQLLSQSNLSELQPAPAVSALGRPGLRGFK